MRDFRTLISFSVAAVAMIATPALAQKSFVAFESGLVRPLALSPDGTKLFAVNTPDATLEIFDVTVAGVSKTGSVPVGLEPVAVAARTNSEVWVVNHLSDSISIVDVTGEPRVTRTLLVGDEPRDIVFAGASGNRAFITTAHRGQNSPFPLSEYDTPGADRADVWVFDATSLGVTLGGAPITIVTLFGDKPRALAASADGSEVYAAIFHSGNKTTSVLEAVVCDTSGPNIAGEITQGPCTLPFIPALNSPGGVPIPHRNHQSIVRPEVGIIVKQNRDGGVTGQWQDELGRDWSSLINFSLPDLDVFKLDADAALPANIVATENWSGVGTTIFNIAINPVSGKVYVSNTDSQNHVRFEGPGIFAAGFKPGGEPATVRSNLAQARITVLDGATVTPRHLNTHIDYTDDPQPVGVKDASLATPLNMVVTPDGATLYVASFGTGEIGVFATAQLEAGMFTPSDASHIHLSGGGPSGLVLDGNRIYTLTRFNNSVVVIDRTLGPVGQEIQSVSLHNPEPQKIVVGRPFLYDSLLTSSTGEASCASCHIEGDMDDIAWDLGNPDDDSVANGNPFEVGSGGPFHPMKGPMTTQSLRGLVFAGPQHWRGDRQGNANAGFNAFNVAFPGLVGRDEGEFSAADMQKFTDFALELTYPPNPIRNLNNSLRANEQLGANLYTGPITDGASDCNGCHVLDPGNGFFGTDGDSSIEGETQEFKIPHLRNAYQKVGMFGVTPVAPLLGGDLSFQGDQIRGFGFLHDGTIDSVFRFLSGQVFGLNDTQQQQLEAFIMAFDSDMAPMVGQQITRTDTNGATVDGRINAMLTAATTSYPSKLLGPGATECQVIVKGIVGGEQASGLLVAGGNILPDDGTAAVSESIVRALSNTPGQELTYTCVPFGSGNRMGLDRDEDGVFNRVDNCPDVFNTAQTDSDMNNVGDACEPGGGGPTTTTTTTTTTSTTTTTTLAPVLAFTTRIFKLGRLNRPAGEHSLMLKSDVLDGLASAHNPLLEDVTLTISVGGVPQAISVVSAGDSGWRLAGKRFKWRAPFVPHPSNMKSISIGVPGGLFKIRFTSKTVDATGATGVSNFGINLKIGDDTWDGTTPSCALSGNGKTLKCH